jgi:hypothetical protein
VDSFTEMSVRGNAVLENVRRKGVQLWLEGTQLRYAAPRGALTETERELLRASREQIIALLREDSSHDLGHEPLRPRRSTDRIPLTYSQVSHWRMYRLGERPHVRQIASATRLSGPLHLDVLRASFDENVRRHEALRTRIAISDEGPEQVILERPGCELELEDLTSSPEAERHSVVSRLMEDFILRPIDVKRDLLFGVKLLKVGADEHVMLVAIEHLISDGTSRNILVRDLMTGYSQGLKGQSLCLPPIDIQFADYAVWQRRTADAWLKQHGAYWNARVSAWRRLRFPQDSANERNCERSGWGSVPVTIDPLLKEQLTDWCRVRGTTTAMTVFTVYAVSVLRWCKVREGIVRYQANGRVSPEVENTIGYFSSALYLHIECAEHDNFVELTRRVTDEYCKAYESADFSYLETLSPQPEFLRNSAFNWQHHKSALDCSGLNIGEDAISCTPLTFVHPMMRTLEWDAEPSIVLFDTDHEIVGGIYFPAERFSHGTMERFARSFYQILKELIRNPAGCVGDLDLPRPP